VPRAVLAGAAASIGVGVLAAAGGLFVAGAALIVTARRWVRQLDKPPRVTAQEQWHKLGAGVSAGTRAWREGSPAA
jgi:O-antigen/teichoic acid export membrane protein